jgi:hypothetical protein
MRPDMVAEVEPALGGVQVLTVGWSQGSIAVVRRAAERRWPSLQLGEPLGNLEDGPLLKRVAGRARSGLMRPGKRQTVSQVNCVWLAACSRW